MSLAIEQLDSIFAPAGPSSPTSLAIKKKRAAKREALAISTPALMSLLPAAKKRRLLLAETASAASSPLPIDDATDAVSMRRRAYKPHSLDDLLERLSSYTLVLWNDGKPLSSSAVAFAKHGWRATRKKREQVRCDMCEQTWDVPGCDDWASAEGQSLQGEVVNRLSSQHASSCPWRKRPCPGAYNHFTFFILF